MWLDPGFANRERAYAMRASRREGHEHVDGGHPLLHEGRNAFGLPPEHRGHARKRKDP